MEAMRGLLALIFTSLLFLVVVAGFIATYIGSEVWTRTTDLLDILLPVVTSLLGSAVGFYFGTQRT
jgi:hypothetical protein